MPVGEIVSYANTLDPFTHELIGHSAEVVLGDAVSFAASTTFYYLSKGGIDASVTANQAQTHLNNNIDAFWSDALAAGRLITYEPEVMVRRLFAVRAILGNIANELYVGGLANQTQGDATLGAALDELAANSTLHNRFNAWRLYMNIGTLTVPGLLTSLNLNLLVAADRRSALRELQNMLGFWLSAADAATYLGI